MEVLEYSSSLLGKRNRDYEVQVAARKGIDNAKQLLQILSQQQQPRSSHGDGEERHSAAGISCFHVPESGDVAESDGSRQVQELSTESGDCRR